MAIHVMKRKILGNIFACGSKADNIPNIYYGFRDRG